MPETVGRPELVEEHIAELGEGERGELRSRARMHALFEVELEAYEAALRKIEEQPSFLPRLAESELLCSAGEPVSYARVRQKLEFRFLFFSRSYEYTLHYNLENSDGARESFAAWWVLLEPIGGQILHVDGSWYFEKVRHRGRSYTYMAYATETLFREKRVGLESALRRLGSRDMRRAMHALTKEAQRIAR
jgi:hypothetical protein